LNSSKNKHFATAMFLIRNLFSKFFIKNRIRFFLRKYEL
jgi:hypothetical protein